MKMTSFDKNEFYNNDVSLDYPECALGSDKVADYVKFIRAVEQALQELPENEILKDRRVAFRTCNRWVLAWYLLEPNVMCLENFLDTVFKHPQFLFKCLLSVAQDTTLLWDPDDKQFWNKPDPSESAVKIGRHVRINWKNRMK